MQRLALGIFLVAGVAGAQSSAPPANAAAQSAKDRSAAYYHYGLAHIYEDLATSQGRSDYAVQAIEEYKLALAADPNSGQLQDGLAELYFKVSRIREAVQAAQEQVKKNPDDIAAHTLLGRIYFRSLGEMQNGSQSQMVQLATQEYETLVRLQPKSVENHLLLGQLYELNHDSLKAEAQFKEARSLDPDSEEALLNMARLYSEQGDLNRVVTTITSLPASDRTARLEYALGATYDQMKKYKDAAAAYQRSLDIDDDNPDAKRALAAALLNDGQMDAALKQYQEMVKADPQDGASYVRIADIQRQQGKYDAALDTLSKAKALVPDDQELAYNQALTYDAVGRYDDAIKVLSDLLQSTLKANDAYADGERSNRALFLDRLATIYREQGKTEQAVAQYRQIILLGGPFASRAYQSIVDAYRDAHQMDKAVEVAAEAAKAMPKDQDIQQTYALQLADTGKVDQGIAVLRGLITGKPEDRYVYLALGMLNTRVQRWKDAAEALDKAEAMSAKPEEKAQVYFQRGALYDRQKRYDDAEAQFRKLLAIDPQNASALNYLGYMLADHNLKLQDSVSLLKKAVELDPQNGSYLDSLGWAYFRSGQYAQAEDLLLKALQRLPEEAAIHDHLGEVYEKTGRLKMAVSQWERSLADYAKTPQGDADPGDVERVRQKLDTARVRLAKVREAKATP